MITPEQQEQIDKWSAELRAVFAKSKPDKLDALNNALDNVATEQDYRWLQETHAHYCTPDAAPKAKQDRKRTWRKADRQYFEKGGELWFTETYVRYCPVTRQLLRETSPPCKAPRQVTHPEWHGRISASVVLHWLRTGEKVRGKVPQPRTKPLKRYRARLRVNGDMISLGYYATPEERDAVVSLARMGIFPEGKK